VWCFCNHHAEQGNEITRTALKEISLDELAVRKLAQVGTGCSPIDAKILAAQRLHETFREQKKKTLAQMQDNGD